MRMANIEMTTRVEKRKLLQTLQENLKTHAAIVQEARDGYIKKAQDALAARLEQLRVGKLVGLSFDLRPPQDYSEVYRNAIAMLEWNQNELIDMQADEFRQLVLDEWDWSDAFLLSNKDYSATASRMSFQKGL